MADRADTRLTAAEGRRFALTLAGGFAVLAVVARLRGRQTAAVVFGAAAAVCMVAGTFAPTRLSGARRAWMRLGDLFGVVMRPVVLGVIYAVVLTPAGIVRRRVSRSPLARRREDASYWFAVTPVADDDARRDMEHMF